MRLLLGKGYWLKLDRYRVEKGLGFFVLKELEVTLRILCFLFVLWLLHL